MDSPTASCRRTTPRQAVVPLTEEQKYLFDARGWLLILGVLSEDEVEEMRAFVLRFSDPESLPEHERSFVAGPPERLTDHPVVVGFLNTSPFPTFLPIATAFAWRGVSCVSPRRANRTFGPHNGHGLFPLPSTRTTISACPAKRFRSYPQFNPTRCNIAKAARCCHGQSQVRLRLTPNTGPQSPRGTPTNVRPARCSFSMKR